MRPHRRQPSRLPRPWDSPGKNTGLGGHFLLQCMHERKSESEVVSNSLQPHGLKPTRLLRPGDFPGESTRVGCRCLLSPRLWQDALPHSRWTVILFSLVGRGPHPAPRTALSPPPRGLLLTAWPRAPPAEWPECVMSLHVLACHLYVPLDRTYRCWLKHS